MDRFIDDSGREVPISGVVEFAQLLDNGTITAETLIYDGTKERWFPAGELPGFPASKRTPPSSQLAKTRAEDGLHLGHDSSPVEDRSGEATQWTVLHDGEEIGPFPESEVVRMLTEDRFPADTKVKTAGMVWPLPANTLAPFRDVTAAEGDDEVLEHSNNVTEHKALEEGRPSSDDPDLEEAAETSSVTKRALLTVPALLSGPVVVLIVTLTVYDFTVVAGLGTMALISLGAVRAVWSG